MSSNVSIWTRNLTVTLDVPIKNNQGTEIVSRGLWITTGGDLVIVLPSGETQTYSALADNTFLGHVAVKQVNSSGTTATGFLAGY